MTRLLTLIFSAIAFGLSGCATSAIHVDPDLEARAEPMPVRRSSFLWREGLSFGPFHVSLSSGIPWERFSGDLRDAGLARQSHRFALTSADVRVEAQCRTRQSARWSIAGIERPAVVHCAIEEIETGPQWMLSINQAGLKRFTGALERAEGAEEMQIQSVHRGEYPARELHDAIGYTITRGSAVIAAVATRGAGRVWLDPALQEQDRLSAAVVAAALVLFDPADDTARR